MEKGDRITTFTLPDQNGNEVSIDDFIGKQPLVIYFYPKDETPGCTKEACTFRDSIKDFEELNAKVIGISADSVESHKAFAENHSLNFTLLSDTDKKVRKLLEVPSDMFGLLDGRVTYVVSKEGIVRHIFKSQLNAARHVEEAKKVLKET
ncbi:MAG: peroxiredoxin [Bacteroidales bacterium]|nr:peroxiredoxin [Bacteroidales bacterium]MCF8336942.1 peroxiredoxin [Bacteroidales bacterium]